MYCPTSVLFRNRLVYLALVTRGDYNNWRDIPIGDWLQGSRYRLYLFSGPRGYRFKVFGKRKGCHSPFDN